VQVWKDAPVRVRTASKNEKLETDVSDSDDEDDTDAREANKIGAAAIRYLFHAF